MRSRGRRDGRHDVVKRGLRGFHRHAVPHAVRRVLRRHIQHRIEGMQALEAMPPIARACHLDLAEDRHQAARLRPLVRVRASVGSQHGLCDRPRTPLVEVGLQQTAQQFAAFDL